MRLRRAALVVAAALFVVLNLGSLVATGYARVAESGLDEPRSLAAAAAARLAESLAPWSSGHAATQGWLRMANGDAAGAEAAYRHALRWSPGDAVLWAEYALALGRLGRIDDVLARAVVQATRLGPTSPAVQRAVAELGLAYWTDGTPELQARWLEAMRFQLRANRANFLALALTRGQAVTFCKGPAEPLGESRWCASVASVLLDGGCYTLAGAEPAPCAPDS